MRVLLLFFLIISFSCREIEPYDNPENVQGYRLEGVLTTVNGIRIGGALVELYYYYNYYSDKPIDTMQAIVTDPSQIVDVSVYTIDNQYLRTIYNGPAGMTGPLPHYDWDGKDDLGNSVPSGKYLIRISIDSGIIKFSTAIIDGHVTAVTDQMGRFVIPNENLPVGELFDVYSLNGNFFASYQVRDYIALVFIVGDRRSQFQSITINKDVITTGAFKF